LFSGLVQVEYLLKTAATLQPPILPVSGKRDIKIHPTGVVVTD
jgi:hypothetical protein